MGFGEPPKFDLARQVTAALAYIALADLDRIAVIAFADDIVADFPLTRGKARILPLLRVPGKPGAAGDRHRPGAAWRPASSAAASGAGWRSSSATCSTRPASSAASTMLRHRRYEPHVVQLHDPREADPPMLGDVELVRRRERQSARKVTVTEKNLRTYRQLFDDYQRAVAALLPQLRPRLHADDDRRPVRRPDPADDAHRGGGASKRMTNDQIPMTNEIPIQQ